MSVIPPKRLSSKGLSYEQFKATTDRFATMVAIRAKTTYPYANDPEFTKNLLLRGFNLFANDPQDGPGKAAIDLFDFSYKLGLPLRPTLIQILRRVLAEKRKSETHLPEVKHKIIVKRWGKVPLPWISHRERYEDGVLASRIYRSGQGIRIETLKEQRLLGTYEGALLLEPSMRNLWRFLISVYASRKLNKLSEDYQSGEHPLAMLNATPEDIAKEIETTNPVGLHGRPLKKMQWVGSQKRLAELFIVLEEKGWITSAVAGAIQRAFNPAASIPDLLKPGKTKKSNKRHYPSVFTPEYAEIFDCIPENSEK